MGNKKVMLVGGKHVGNVSNRIFEGEVTENKRDIRWKELESMNKRRYYHLTFIMHGNIYVAGGSEGENAHQENVLSSCERYDLSEEKWFDCQHSLPYPLWRASVVVCADESFALITGGLSETEQLRSDGIIIFTEGQGFRYLNNSLLRISRVQHTSVQLP